MKLLATLKGMFKRKPKPVPVAEPLPEEEVPPLVLYVTELAAEYTARIEELRVLEVEAVSDSLRGKYRSRREEAEMWRDRLAEALK